MWVRKRWEVVGSVVHSELVMGAVATRTATAAVAGEAS
jgi:hypothetical protein